MVVHDRTHVGPRLVDGRMDDVGGDVSIARRGHDEAFWCHLVKVAIARRHQEAAILTEARRNMVPHELIEAIMVRQRMRRAVSPNILFFDPLPFAGCAALPSLL